MLALFFLLTCIDLRRFRRARGTRSSVTRAIFYGRALLIVDWLKGARKANVEEGMALAGPL